MENAECVGLQLQDFGRIRNKSESQSNISYKVWIDGCHKGVLEYKGSRDLYFYLHTPAAFSLVLLKSERGRSYLFT